MNKQALRQVKNEVLAAELAINSMKEAKSMDDFEINWRNYLNCLEKIWVKAERSCQHIRNTFQP